jgi:mono/diheme cytochrome c family protein
MSTRRTIFGAIGIVVLLGIGLIGFIAWKMRHAAATPAQPALQVSAATLFTQSIPDGPNAEQLRRGQYLVREGDCISCHLSVDGKSLAGGIGLNTPFGVVYSENISADPHTGIGNWTPDQFYHAMHDGIGILGERLYPAFPYPWFTHVAREDDDAILAYLKTLPAADYKPPAPELPFPLNVRATVAGWDWLYLNKDAFAKDANQSDEWNRGAQIVNGLGHCGGCHTPKNALGADKRSHAFEGGVLDNWVAPDLTENEHTGLGRWNVDEIAEFLHTGRNARANAGGRMADVVTFSTSLMREQDVHAIAVYLKSLAARTEVAPAQPPAEAMKTGAQIYVDACASCHLQDGVGQPRTFPPLGGDTVVQQDDPTGVLHIIMAGSRTGPGATRPSPLSMPSFAWKLDNQEIADVATYIRNSWGNRAAPVSADAAEQIRGRLKLGSERMTDNSSDRR